MTMDLNKMNEELRQNPFDAFMGFRLIQADEEDTILAFENKSNGWDNPNGNVYGGVLYAMAAAAMEAAGAVRGKALRTVDLGMNYLRPAFGGTTIEGHVKVLHNGRTTFVALCDLYDSEGRFLAHGKGTFVVTGPYVPGKDDDHGPDEL